MPTQHNTQTYNCNARGADVSAIHQSGIVVVFDKVTTFCIVGAVLWLHTGDLNVIRWVVEINNVDIKHQHS